MKIIEPSVEILTPINEDEILKHIELCARNCYKSEERITDGSALKMFDMLLNKGHMSLLEHYSISVRIVCDRGVSHELVRHRLASYAQESTRYCKYDNEISVIEPCFLDRKSSNDFTKIAVWTAVMDYCEQQYLLLLELGATPEQSRTVLPNSLKTEIIMTANLREWMHFFDLRYVGTTGRPHPQMKQIAGMILEQFLQLMPNIFQKYKEDE